MFQSLHYPKRQVTHVYYHRKICQHKQTNRPSQIRLHRQLYRHPKTSHCFLWLSTMCRRRTWLVFFANYPLDLPQLFLNLLFCFYVALIIDFLTHLKPFLLLLFLISECLVRRSLGKIVEKVPLLKVLGFEVEKVKHWDDESYNAWKNAG